MTFLVAAPDVVAHAAGQLANVGSMLSEASSAAAGPTTALAAAGADEISAAIAELFSAHAQTYQAVNAQAALFHQQFVQSIAGAGASYAAAEALNASPLQAIEQGVLGVVNAPTQLLLGRPLIGDGANATTPGGAGGAGGLLWGNGGNGAAG
ncbi:PE family protein, partial [Mycobacterium gordonae]|uniref:PE family protein n=2 Tax=Mycobacteriaceae TaxID=1762 RepID=UPI000A7B3B55